MIPPQIFPKHLEFNFGFVRASVLLALTAGFAISGLLGMVAIALFGWNLRQSHLSALHSSYIK